VAKVFISHASENLAVALEVQQWLVADGHETFLDQDVQEGIRVGEEWELRLYERLRWADAMVCIVTPAYVASPWCAAEVGIARSQGSRLLPLRAEPGRPHPLLDSVQQLDMAAGESVARSRLGQALQVVDAVGGFGWSDDREPYPGLRSLTSEQHRVFFGRGTEVEELASLLRSPAHRSQAACLLVVGPSGCGKSSLVRAGLVPVLGQERDWWTLAPFMPGTDPVGAVAREFAAGARQLGLGWSLADVRARLDDGRAADLVDELLLAVPGNRRRHLLLVVDQFEELITQAPATDRTRFAGLLRGAMNGQAMVVATLRPEFLDQLLSDPGLNALPTRAYPVRPLPPQALRNVVEGPARVAGIGIDDDLVTRLVTDTDGGEALPLLAYTLAELARGVGRGGRMVVSRYDQLGGVRGAITRQADAALEDATRVIGSDGSRVIKELLRLVAVDEQGRPTRRRVLRSELPPNVLAGFEPFVVRRLLTTDRDGGDSVVGVAHEAFLSAWPPLAAAIQDAASALRARRQIEQAAAGWTAEGNGAGRLWERGQLASALADTGARLRPPDRGPGRRRLMERRELVSDRVDLSRPAREFLTASVRRDRFLRRRAVTVLSSLLVLSLVAAGVAYAQQRSASRQQNVATARELAATAVSNENTHLDLAQLLAVEGYRRNPDPQTRAALFSATTASPQLVRYLHADSDVSTLTASQDGGVVVAGTATGRTLRWSLGHPGPAQEVADLKDRVSSVATSDDGAVVVASDGSQAIIWDQRDGSRPAPVRLGRGLSPGAVGISPSGRWLAVTAEDASGGLDGPAQLVVTDLQAGTSSTAVLGITGVDQLMFPDESQVVAVDKGYGTWQRLSLSPLLVASTSDQSITGAHEYAAAVGPDGAYFTWTNASPQIPVWGTGGPADPDRPALVAIGPGHFPEALAVSAGGGLVAVADTGSIYVSGTGASADSATSGQALTGNPSINIDGLVFVGAAARTLASATGSSIALWDLNQLGRIGKAVPMAIPSSCNACPGPEVVVSPDGRRVAVQVVSEESVAVATSPLAADSSSQSVRFLSLTDADGAPFGPMHWTRDSGRLLIRVPQAGSVSVRVDAPDGPVVQTVDVPSGEDRIGLDRTAPGDPDIVLVAAQARPLDDTDALWSRADGLLGDAVHEHAAQSPHAGPMVADAATSEIASVVTTYTAQGDVNSDVWLVRPGRGTVDVVPVGDAVQVAFTKDRMLIAREFGPLEIRDASGRHVMATVPGGPTDTQGLAASTGSELAVRLRQDGTLVLIDAGRGAVLGSLGDPSQVQYGLTPGLAFTPDGRDLFLASPYEPSLPGTGQLRQYVTDSAAWVRIACDTAGRAMTSTEWRQFINGPVPTEMACGPVN
jgi:WD40 repeat protein